MEVCLSQYRLATINLLKVDKDLIQATNSNLNQVMDSNLSQVLVNNLHQDMANNHLQVMGNNHLQDIDSLHLLAILVTVDLLNGLHSQLLPMVHRRDKRLEPINHLADGDNNNHRLTGHLMVDPLPLATTLPNVDRILTLRITRFNH